MLCLQFSFIVALSVQSTVAIHGAFRVSLLGIVPKCSVLGLSIAGIVPACKCRVPRFYLDTSHLSTWTFRVAASKRSHVRLWSTQGVSLRSILCVGMCLDRHIQIDIDRYSNEYRFRVGIGMRSYIHTYTYMYTCILDHV